MNNNGNKFMDGFVLGAVIGGAAVFLFGTRTGKNLMKIVSEQGLDGLVNLLEEYDLADWEEEEEFEEPTKAASSSSNSQVNEQKEAVEETKNNSKRRFFKKLRR